MKRSVRKISLPLFVKSTTTSWCFIICLLFDFVNSLYRPQQPTTLKINSSIDMTLLVPILVLFLLASSQADIKILDTPDGKMGPEPCVRVCSGVDKDYSGWIDSDLNPGKVHKYIDMSGCDFVSQPVVTAVSGNGVRYGGTCPTFHVSTVRRYGFALYSLSDFTKDIARRSRCKVFWTATGFAC